MARAGVLKIACRVKSRGSLDKQQWRYGFKKEIKWQITRCRRVWFILFLADYGGRETEDSNEKLSTNSYK